MSKEDPNKKEEKPNKKEEKPNKKEEKPNKKEEKPNSSKEDNDKKEENPKSKRDSISKEKHGKNEEEMPKNENKQEEEKGKREKKRGSIWGRRRSSVFPNRKGSYWEVQQNLEKDKNEVDVRLGKSKDKKKPCCTCCGLFASPPEEELDENKIYNLVYDFDNTWALEVKGDLTVDTGTFEELRAIRSGVTEHGTLEECRIMSNVTRTIPKLKLKNKKAQAAVKHRRKAQAGTELKIPMDKSVLSKDTGYLSVMDTHIDLLDDVLCALVNHVESLPSKNKAITGKKKGKIVLPKGVMKNCAEILREIEKNWILTVPYLEHWLSNYPVNKLMCQKHRSIDKWVVSFYSSSDPMDEISEFGCLLVREILDHYRIAYEEKDIAIDKNSFKDELQDKLNGGIILIPYVFVANLKLGGCRVIWALHKLNLINDVFKDYMMDEDEYHLWKYELRPKRVEILLNVPLYRYPSLDIVVRQKKVRTHCDNLITIADGKSVLRYSKVKWSNSVNQYLSDLSLFIYVVIKETITFTFSELDELFWYSLFPTKPYSDDTKAMKTAIKKKCVEDYKNSKKKGSNFFGTTDEDEAVM